MKLKMPTSENMIKGSAIFLHAILLVLVISILGGRETPIIADIYSSTMWAILANLAAISGNKGLQRFIDKLPGKAKPTEQPT